MFRLLLGAALFLLLGTACTPDPQAQLRRQLIENPTTRGEIERNQLLEYALQKQWNVQATPSGMYYLIEEPGRGEDHPTADATVTFFYTCERLDGFVCGDSRERGQATQLDLASRGVIPGWIEAFSLLKKGGRGKFLLPSALAHGERGAGTFIPPNTPLVYALELIRFGERRDLVKQRTRKEEGEIRDFLAEKGWTMQRAPSGLYYRIDVEGEGDRYPNLQSKVRVRYQGSFLDGFSYAQSPKTGEWVELGSAMDFWQQAIPLLQKGGKGTFVVPSGLAFGSREVGSIPANSVLVAEFELLDFE